MKDITKLKFVIIRISTIIGISTIITICAYSSIGANSSQLAPNVENLVPNFWTYMNGTVGTSLAPLAGRWHVFIFPDTLASLSNSLLLIVLYISLSSLSKGLISIYSPFLISTKALALLIFAFTFIYVKYQLTRVCNLIFILFNIKTSLCFTSISSVSKEYSNYSTT